MVQSTGAFFFIETLLTIDSLQFQVANFVLRSFLKLCLPIDHKHFRYLGRSLKTQFCAIDCPRDMFVSIIITNLHPVASLHPKLHHAAKVENSATHVFA